MAKLEITGRVHSVGNTITINGKNGTPFYKRELFLDTTPYDRYTGQRSEYESFPKFEFRKNNCSKLDNVKVGDVVKISFDITGCFYTNRDGQQSHMNRIDAFEIEVVRSEQTQQPAQPTMQQQQQQFVQSVNQPAPQQPVNHFGQQPMGQQSYGGYGQQQNNNNAPF